MKKIFDASKDSVEDIIDYISLVLKKKKYKDDDAKEKCLMATEALNALYENISEEDSQIQVKINSGISYAKITITAYGTKVDDVKVRNKLNEIFNSNDETTDVMGLYFDKYFKYRRQSGYNTFKIIVGSEDKGLYTRCIAAMVGGIVLALLFKFFLSDELVASIQNDLFLPITKIFMNILKLLTGPMVFLAILTNVAKFSAMHNRENIKSKVLVTYLTTTVLSVLIGLVTFTIFKPEYFGVFKGLFNANADMNIINKPALDLILGIVPKSFVEPFVKIDTLQIIFLGALCGIAIGKTGDDESRLKRGVNALYNFFGKITELLLNFMPISVFLATAIVVFNSSSVVIDIVVRSILMIVVGLVVIVAIYIAMMLILGRVNPITFFRKSYNLILEGMWNGSGLSILSEAMKNSEKKLGIPKKICDVAMPFGALMNIDGTCIYLTISSLYVCFMSGISFDNMSLGTIIFTIIFLSIGAPITPGSVLICLTIIISEVGLSMESLIIYLALNALLEMFTAVTNFIGDSAVCIALAGIDKSLDKETYNRM